MYPFRLEFLSDSSRQQKQQVRHPDTTVRRGAKNGDFTFEMEGITLQYQTFWIWNWQVSIFHKWNLGGKAWFQHTGKDIKFNGSYSISYYENVIGERGIDFSKSKDFAFVWSHSQDTKANPNRRFSANVNFTTGSYDRNHSRNINNVMQRQKQSSITFSRYGPIHHLTQCECQCKPKQYWTGPWISGFLPCP